MMALIYLTIIGTTIWLGFDAHQRDWRNSSFARSTAIWVLGAVALWLVVFPLYLVMRTRAPLKQAG